jgi:biopolymer transport protein ExbD
MILTGLARALRLGLGDSKVEVPITPMLDMTFQLLFFFIITYDPRSVFEGQLDLSLPAHQDTLTDPNLPQKPPDEIGDEPPPEEPPEVTVVIKTQHDGIHDGVISHITVRDNAGETAIPLTADPSLPGLVEHLKQVRGTLANQTDVKVQGDSRLKWEAIVRVRDACQKAGFVNASFAPPPDLGLGQ